MKHRESNLKISRWVLKLFELNINFIVSHTEGSRHLIAHFLSRIHMVPEEITDAKHNLKLKSAVHIKPSFNPLHLEGCLISATPSVNLAHFLSALPS